MKIRDKLKAFIKEVTPEQKRGMANFFDTVSSASIIGFVLSVTGHTDTSTFETFCLLLTSVILFIYSFILRR